MKSIALFDFDGFVDAYLNSLSGAQMETCPRFPGHIRSHWRAPRLSSNLAGTSGMSPDGRGNVQDTLFVGVYNQLSAPYRYPHFYRFHLHP